jgi:hypothetical protein
MLAAIEGAGYGKIPPHPGMWVTDGRGPGHPAGPGTVVYETPEPWRIPLSLPVRCPVGGCSWLDIARPHRSAHLIEAITHLNDHHRWSREAIADWIEPIENAYCAGRENAIDMGLVPANPPARWEDPVPPSVTERRSVTVVRPDGSVERVALRSEPLSGKAIERMWRDEGVRDQALWDELRALDKSKMSELERAVIDDFEHGLERALTEQSRAEAEGVEETVSQV